MIQLLHVTRPQVLAYVAKLDPKIQQIWFAADRYFIETNDTLSEEFQIAASVLMVFEERAKEAL